MPMAFRNLSKCLGCYRAAHRRSYMPKGIKKTPENSGTKQ